MTVTVATQQQIFAWQLWQDGQRSPAMNMAVDEALLSLCGADQAPLVRTYGWDRPSWSIGCFQSWQAAPECGCFVRRPTGGGVVDHRHDYTYTVVLPGAHPVCALSAEESYAYINAAVVEALRALSFDARFTDACIADRVDRRTMVCFSNPTKYDVVYGGRKVAGAAQRRRRAGILHQGSIELSALGVVERRSVDRALSAGLEGVFGAPPGEFDRVDQALALADSLCAEVYDQESWNYRR